MTLPFEFEASDVVRNDGDVWVEFNLGVVWREVETDARSLEYTLTDSAGAELRSGTFDSGVAVLCGVQCIGGGQLAIEWKAAATGGTAVVDWHYRAGGGFEENDLPEGAAIEFEVTGPDPRTDETVVIAGRLVDIGLARERVTIRPGDGRLWLELPGSAYLPEETTSIFLVADGDRVRVSPGDAIPLERPPGCEVVCEWTLDLVRVDERHMQGPGYRDVAWQLVQIGGATAATAEVAVVEPPALKAEVEGVGEALGVDEAVSRRVLITVPSAGVAMSDFDETDPWVDVTLSSALVAGSSFDDGTLSHSIIGSFGTTRGSVWSRDTPRQLRVRTKLVCDGEECTAELTVGHESAELSNPVRVEWTVVASLSYPFSDAVPEGAEMILEVRR